MYKKIIYAACLATVMASCNQVEIPEYQVMSLDINVTTAAETKAIVSGTALPSGSSVGLFVTDESETTYDGITVSNIKYTNTGNGQSQAWATDEDIMLSATKATLRGYYPYNESVTDISTIPIQATSDVQNDWMWATPVTDLNNKNYTATMTMNHALSAVRLSIVRGSYSGVAEVTSVAFKSEGAATDAVLDATDGSLSSINGAGAQYVSIETFTIGDEKKSFDFITVPAGVSAPVAIEVMVNGSKMVAESDDVLLEAGKLYEYALAIGTEGIFVSSMNVNEWNIIDKGTVKIEPGQGGSAEPETPSEPDETSSNVWILATNGKTYSKTNWDDSQTAVGVGVSNGEHSFIIHPTAETYGLAWSSDYTNGVDGVTTTDDQITAEEDFAGKTNTDAILAAVANGTITDAPAAQYCASITFANGQQGYLPAAGEIKLMSEYMDQINEHLTRIGGTEIKLNTFYYWTSTQYLHNASQQYLYSMAWCWNIPGYDDLKTYAKNNTDVGLHIRAICLVETDPATQSLL